MNIQDIQNEIVEEFEMLGDDWQEKYAYIMQLGRELPLFPEKLRDDSYKVKGCQSNVWLVPELKETEKLIHFNVDSDALLVKGLAALVVRVYNDRSPEEILEAEPDFIGRIGLQQHLSPTRSNGLASMIKQIKMYAYAYKSKLDGQK